VKSKVFQLNAGLRETDHAVKSGIELGSAEANFGADADDGSRY
jgi:hypothetical protein